MNKRKGLAEISVDTKHVMESVNALVREAFEGGRSRAAIGVCLLVGASTCAMCDGITEEEFLTAAKASYAQALAEMPK